MRSVVHVGAPVPKKSLSSVQVGHSNANAVARMGPVVRVTLLDPRQRLGLVIEVDLLRHRKDGLPQPTEVGQRRFDLLSAVVLGEDLRQVPLRVVIGDLRSEELRLDRVVGDDLLDAPPEHGPDQDVGVQDKAT